MTFFILISVSDRSSKGGGFTFPKPWMRWASMACTPKVHRVEKQNRKKKTKHLKHQNYFCSMSFHFFKWTMK